MQRTVESNKQTVTASWFSPSRLTTRQTIMWRRTSYENRPAALIMCGSRRLQMSFFFLQCVTEQEKLGLSGLLLARIRSEEWTSRNSRGKKQHDELSSRGTQQFMQLQAIRQRHPLHEAKNEARTSDPVLGLDAGVDVGRRELGEFRA
ncbi:unnamed protein product [Symbiodinium sp. CCMP2592]|nr:unnamed protein product [Symbiodinium sp. CCMP2592]